MKLFKFSKILLALLFLLSLSVNFSSAGGNRDVCKGQPVNLIWTSSGATSCSGGVQSGSLACSFGASLGGSLSIPNPQSSCTVNYNCTNGQNAGDSASLTVDTTRVWNGSGCVAPAPGVKSGTVSGTCVVPIGSSTCTAQIDWSSANLISSQVWVRQVNPANAWAQLSGNPSGSFSAAWISGGTTLFEMRDGADIIYSHVAGSCAVGSTWNGSICAAGSCPTGQTGTPPNCVVTPTSCPTGYTGTQPNCIPPAACVNGAVNPPVCDYIPPCANGATNYPGCSIFEPCANGATNAPACTIGIKQPTGDVYEFPSDIAAPQRPCIIEFIPGSNTYCNAFLGWTTQYSIPSALTAITTPGGFPGGTSVNPNGGANYFRVDGIAPKTFYLYHNAVLLDQVTVTPTCKIGSDWNGTGCVAGTCANGATNYPTCNIFPTCANGLNSTYQPLCACSAVQEQLPGSNICTFKVNNDPVKISAFLVQPSQIACPGGNDEANLIFTLNNTPGKTCRISAKEINATPVLPNKTEQINTLNSSTQLKSSKYKSSNSNLSGYTKTFEQLIEDRNTNTGFSGGQIIMKAPKFDSGKRLFNYSTRFTMECGSLAEPIATRYVKTNATYSSKSVDMLSICIGQD